MRKYLFLDGEFGGRELKFSLLTISFVIMDEQFNVIDELSINTKPDDGCYILSGQGMAVNGINIQTHDKIAIPYKNAKTLVYNFLKKNSTDTKLIPVGQGVRGDIGHLTDKLISEGSWEQFCTYHFIDTSVVLQFLRMCGKLPFDCDGSIEALVKFFDPSKQFNFHDAREDCLATAFVLKKFIETNNMPNLNI